MDFKPDSAALICLILGLYLASGVAYAAGDWPMPRRDLALTGRATLKGNILSPQIIDKIFIGAYEGLAVIHPSEGRHILTSTGAQEVSPNYLNDHADEWKLDGASQSAIEDARLQYSDGKFVRYAKILPDVPGLQKAEFLDEFSAKNPKTLSLYAFDQDKDKPRLIWQTEKEKETVQKPTILVVDVDDDGQPEIAAAAHYRVMVYNGQTGAKKMELTYHNMRNYGFFGCFKLPGERYPKFVVVGDFSSHIEVLDNNGKELSVLWELDIEPSINIKDTVTHVGPDAIADIDGDGVPEITINLFDYSGDKKWHVTVFDALTGKIRFDLADTYVRGLADVDGDGVAELFLQDPLGLAVPEHSPIRLISLKDGKQRTLWSHPMARWQLVKLSHLPLTTNTYATNGRETVLVGEGKQGKELYAIEPGHNPKSGETLHIIARDGNRWKPRAAITGPPYVRLDLKAISKQTGERDLLLAWRTSDAGPQLFKTNEVSGEVVSRRRVSGPESSLVAARLRDGEPPTLLVQNGNDEIEALQKKSDGWQTRWKTHGRGMTQNAINYLSCLAADVDGDGNKEILFARRGKTGEAEIVAADADGRVKWSHAFTNIDGAAPVWNWGGIAYWTVGRFTARDRLDVFVNVRRSTMHSYEGYCFDGRNGHTIWKQDVVYEPGGRTRLDAHGYGGNPMAVVDPDGDGFDELICTYPTCFWIASGKDGNVRKTVSPVFPGIPSYYAIPVVADFYGDHGYQVLWSECPGVTGLLTVDGEALWHGEKDDGPVAVQGCGKVDESGKMLIGGVHNDGFRCYDARTGSVLWTFALPAPGAGGPTITADVNSDGLDEFLFTKGEMLYALNGKDGKANLVWSLLLPVTPGPLSYADADGDGKPEILFIGSDSYLYIAGEK